MQGTADWSTPAARVKWLVENVSKGNRSAFADTVGVTHPTISKVVAGKPPGRKLLTFIAQHLRVNSEWLLTGEGQPFRDEAEQGGASWVPISATPLPGSPQDNPDLVSRDWVVDCRTLFRPTQYWLRLGPREPITREPSRGFLSGDLILLESDRRLFPREALLNEQLCVIRFPGGDVPLKLAAVRYDAGEGAERFGSGLWADPFDLEPDPSRQVEEVTYRHYPDGRVTRKSKPLVLKEFRGGERAVPLDSNEVEPACPQILYGDVVAVWTGILSRPGGGVYG